MLQRWRRPASTSMVRTLRWESSQPQCGSQHVTISPTRGGRSLCPHPPRPWPPCAPYPPATQLLHLHAPYSSQLACVANRASRSSARYLSATPPQSPNRRYPHLPHTFYRSILADRLLHSMYIFANSLPLRHTLHSPVLHRLNRPAESRRERLPPRLVLTLRHPSSERHPGHLSRVRTGQPSVHKVARAPP